MDANKYKAKHKHSISDTDFKYVFTPKELKELWDMIRSEEMDYLYNWESPEPKFKSDYEN